MQTEKNLRKTDTEHLFLIHSLRSWRLLLTHPHMSRNHDKTEIMEISVHLWQAWLVCTRGQRSQEMTGAEDSILLSLMMWVGDHGRQQQSPEPNETVVSH